MPDSSSSSAVAANAAASLRLAYASEMVPARGAGARGGGEHGGVPRYGLREAAHCGAVAPCLPALRLKAGLPLLRRLPCPYHRARRPAGTRPPGAHRPPHCAVLQ